MDCNKRLFNLNFSVNNLGKSKACGFVVFLVILFFFVSLELMKISLQTLDIVLRRLSKHPFGV